MFWGKKFYKVDAEKDRVTSVAKVPKGGRLISGKENRDFRARLSQNSISVNELNSLYFEEEVLASIVLGWHRQHVKATKKPNPAPTQARPAPAIVVGTSGTAQAT